MKRSACLIITLITVSIAHSQVIKKYPIGNSGCSAYLYCQPTKFTEDYSEDSSKVYTGECEKEGVNYGIICIKLLNPVTDLSAAEDVTISYLDYLKGSFGITSSAGYGKGHHLKDDENTRGVLDYWEDKDKNHWKIKAWTDGKFIGVMYAYSSKELPETKVNLFLEGFRLPGK